MYADFMKKKIVNIWGQNFTEVLKKNCPEANASFLKCVEEAKKSQSPEKKLLSKNKIEKKVSY